MPGGRPIHGADVRAVLHHAARPEADAAALAAAVGEDDVFLTLEELATACPPERIGLAPGAYAALFGPLFGEFE
jgi:hypothetical protein